MIVSKIINDHYPDLIAHGGLAKALQSALRECGSSLTAREPDAPFPIVFVCVESGSRFSQVYVAELERMFSFDFWSRGVVLAHGRTPQLPEMARAIDKWVASSCTSADLAAAFAFVVPEQKAVVYERGLEVEDRWQSYIKSIGYPELEPFVVAAAHRPQLRQLFPYTSLNMFCFSRCTGYPFTRDTPYVRPLTEGGYEVVSPTGVVLGRGDAEDAAELVVVHLPPDCGPAVAGTEDDLARPETGIC